MWNYEKRLQFPINITSPNAMLAQAIISQYGGPDGEMGASKRYLSQRNAAPYREVASILTDIGTEELGHLEMVATIVHQLTKDLSMEEIEKSGFANYYVDHTVGIWPQAAGGFPFSAAQFQSTGDIITDLMEDMAADATLSNIQLHSYATSHNTEYHPYAISHNTKISSVLRLGEDHPCALYGLTGRLQYSQ